MIHIEGHPNAGWPSVRMCGNFDSRLKTQLKVDMPEVFRERGFRFFFYSNEGSPREPIHIHVESDNQEAKFWLNPNVSVSYNDGYDARTLRELQILIEANKNRIVRAWNEHCI